MKGYHEMNTENTQAQQDAMITAATSGLDELLAELGIN